MKMLKICVLVITVLLMKQTANAQIWKPLGQGFQQVPVAVAPTSDYIYFAFVDSTTLSNKNKFFAIARWNGVFWQNLSSFIAGPASTITSMVWYKDRLYTAGYFDTVLFTSSKTGMLMLDGKKWTNAAKRRADDQTPIHINDVTVFENYLYAAGNFTRIDTTRATGVARYNGTAWEGIEELKGGTYTGLAFALDVFNDTLYVGGVFNKVSSNKNIPVFKIKGNTNTSDSTSPFYVINTLQSGTNELMALGYNTNSEKTIYSYQNGRWLERTKGFTNVKTSTIADVEFYNNEAWVPLEDLSLNSVRFVKAFRNRLFVTGGFENYRRIQLNHVAEFDDNLAIITGRVYWDINNNCKRDAGEKPVPGQIIRLFNGLFVGYTDKEGIYSFIVPNSGTYEINTLLRKYWTLSNCNPNQYVYKPANNGPIFDSADFAINLANVKDVSVKILPNAGYNMRRGFTELYSLTYSNNGGATVPTGTIRLKIDDSLKNFSALPPPASVTNGVAVWNFTNLNPGDENTILFKGKVSSTNTSAIQLMAEAVNSSDAFAEDNFDTLQQTVDDNSRLSGKYIYPEPEKGDTVTVFEAGHQYDVQYLIRFENTTPDTINTVVVIDTIDLNLSIEYIQELGSSHSYTTQIINLPPQLGKAVLIWTFSNINLPPNPSKDNDYTDNRGHIRFKIQLNDKTPIGTLVKNKADVSFDYTPPHSTNNVFCMLQKTVGIQKVTQTLSGISIYPNPTTTQLNIVVETEGAYTCTVTDIQGRTCLPATQFSGNGTNLNTAALAQGVYFLRITAANGQTAYRKFVIE
jgi:uncharacterized repeat protein (TIGR01451 family)